MKYALMICEGLAGEPSIDLSGRTPLEAAKKPHLDELAKIGHMGTSSFIPSGLSVSGDVAALSLLGYDAKEHYTGLAPLEAAAYGVAMDDRHVFFRADLINVSDGILFDRHAGFIPSRESQILMEALNRGLSSPDMKFISLAGFKNILQIGGPAAEEWDALECESPAGLDREPCDKHWPKGKMAHAARDLMKRAGEILEGEEINRVRVDLNENPGNAIWLWGQGKRPRLPHFQTKHGLPAAYYAEPDFAKGLARLLGMREAIDIGAAFEDADFLFVYWGGDDKVKGHETLKGRIRHIEEFDTLVGHVHAALKKEENYRILAAAPYPDPAPYVMAGRGVEPDGAAAFSEKLAAQGRLAFKDGHKILEFLLKT